LQEFLYILTVSPGSLETRVLIQKTMAAMAKPKTEERSTIAEDNQKECLWVIMGIVAHRICTNYYDCITCEFDQAMQEKIASGDPPELETSVFRLKKLPGNQRLCRYTLKGDVSFRLCTRLYRCASCEFSQRQEDVVQDKINRLDERREALRRHSEKSHFLYGRR